MEGFKSFLLNEEKSYLGHRIGDVLTAVHNLEEDLPGMGSRQISRICEEIVNQIRKILHDQWTPSQMSKLKDLQKIGVALMKAIDEKGDLKTLIPVISSQLENLSGKMGMRTNDIQPPSDETPDGQDVNMQLTGMGPNQPGASPQPGMATMPPEGVPPVDMPPQ